MSAPSLAALSSCLVGLIEQAAPGVVGVQVARRSRSRATGVSVARGFVVTNAHVVRDSPLVQVSYQDGAAETARVQGVDDYTDLALLRVERSTLPTLAWGDSEAVRPGHLILAIANPLLLERSATLGIVSATHRAFGRRGGRWIDGIIQTDAVVAPGSSGGVLLASDGHIVGLILAGSSTFHGLAFAIPSVTAEWVVDELARNGRVQRVRLGLQVKTVLAPPDVQAAIPGLHRCVLVRRVERAGPGDIAGIRTGDVLVAAGNRPLTGVHVLQRYLGRHSADRSVEVELLREGRIIQAQLALGGACRDD